MSKIINTNIRLNLDNEADRKAWEYLQGMDRKKYKSYTKAVVIAVNEHFDRQQRLASDPYLETREKEDRFLQKILDTIQNGLNAAGNIGGFINALQSLTANQEQPTKVEENTEADNDAVLDFAESLG